MHPEPPSHDAVRKLLALKRYEQPPPGFFDRFSESVVARLEADEAREVLPWWERLVAGFELRPAFAAAFGLTVLGTYLFGMSLADRVDRDLGPAPTSVADSWRAVAAPGVTPLAEGASRRPLAQPAGNVVLSSMNPVTGSGAPRWMFAPGAALEGTRLLPAAFSPVGN